MGKLIVLKLDGDFNQGFRVTLEIWLEGDRREVEIIGNLPPATYLIQEYGDWQSIYRSLGKRYRIIKVRETRSDVSLKKKIQECRTQAFKLRDWQSIYRSLGKRYRIIKVRETRSDVSLEKKIQECRTQAFKLRDRLNSWLKADSFLSIREKWLEKVSTSDDVRVMIRADNHQLWQLPWQQWDLLERYSFAEIELSSLEYERPPKVQESSQKDQIKILAILGHSEGINVEEDRKRLENLPNAATTFLVEPQRQELNDQLWQQTWDILFFAGHSQTEGERGRIYLNQTDSLTLDELRYALQKAVDGGLQLAIFNSCDGLGLARDLAQLHIPQLIVMREPVADQVAQEFLQYFLDSFASGKPLYRAVQEARQRLQGLEEYFPCASWLPVICQNPASVPLRWPQLSEPAKEPPPEPDTTPILPLWPRLRTLVVTSLVVTSIVMGGRSLGIMQRWELKAYDHLLRQRPSETPDSRILLVGANEEDLRKYKHPLSDAVLAQIIAKLQQYRPLAIGLDIFRDQPVPPGYGSFVTQLQQNQHLFTVCFGTESENSVAPPPKSPAEQLGFNDLENDHPDNAIRRHLQSRTPNPISSRSPCKTPYSFSLQLAYRYLEAQGISGKANPEQNWQFGNVVFKRLESHSGGYQNLDGRGNQVLINYRATPQIAQQVTVEEVLSGKLEPEWVKDRVVLIGVTAASIQDYHHTPYGRMRGLEIHAHMVSQTLSAVLDKRPLIWWLSQWGDVLWVWVWSLTGGIVVCIVRWRSVDQAQSPLRLVLALSFSVIVLYGLCWVFLLQGGWLPLVPAALALVATGSAIGFVAAQDNRDLPTR